MMMGGYRVYDGGTMEQQQRQQQQQIKGSAVALAGPAPAVYRRQLGCTVPDTFFSIVVRRRL